MPSPVQDLELWAVQLEHRRTQLIGVQHRLLQVLKRLGVEVLKCVCACVCMHVCICVCACVSAHVWDGVSLYV